MECRNQNPAVARQHGMPVDLGEDLDVRPRVLDPWRANEDRAHRLVAVTDVDVRLEGMHLPAERVPGRADVGEPEMLAVEHDHPGAGAKDGAVEAEPLLSE